MLETPGLLSCYLRGCNALFVTNVNVTKQSNCLLLLFETINIELSHKEGVRQLSFSIHASI